MNDKDLILNFVRQYKRPFSCELASDMTALDLNRVEPIIRELAAEGYIKLITEGIYVKANRYNPSVCYRQKGTWNFRPEKAAALLDFIEQGSYTSIREITTRFPRSRQWVYVYLEALASIDVIGYDTKYYVKSRSHLTDIGKVIKQGILREINPNWNDPNRKTTKQLKAEAAERRRIKEEQQDQIEEARRKRIATKEAKKAEWEKIKQQREIAHQKIRAMIAHYNDKYSN